MALSYSFVTDSLIDSSMNQELASILYNLESRLYNYINDSIRSISIPIKKIDRDYEDFFRYQGSYRGDIIPPKSAIVKATEFTFDTPSGKSLSYVQIFGTFTKPDNSDNTYSLDLHFNFKIKTYLMINMYSEVMGQHYWFPDYNETNTFSETLNFFSIPTQKMYIDLVGFVYE